MYLYPQTQVIWNGIKAGDYTETNGTHVTSNENNNVQTRLGVKLSRDTVSDMDKGKDKLFTTYVEANWLHNTEQAGTVMDGVTIKQMGNSNVGELKLGAEGQLTKHANLWANVVQKIDDKGYSNTTLTV
ncbi:TPA: autotransporter outer membrane beta-barrel domain-containing protein [Yersinia enterocolitica]